MYFFFSKILLFLVIPLNWIIALFILSFVIKSGKTKHRLRVASLLLLLLFTNNFLINAFARFWDITDTKLDSHKKYSCVIILGGYVSQKDGRNGYFNGSADRYIEGVKLYENGTAQHILISGANGSLIPDGFIESTWVMSQLKEMSIPPSAIIAETKSRNTKENAAFSKQLLATDHLAAPYILVTSAFHMRRSLYLFRKAGMNVVPYASNYIAGIGENSVWNLMPDAEVLSRWNTYIKEVIGYAVAHFQS